MDVLPQVPPVLLLPPSPYHPRQFDRASNFEVQDFQTSPLKYPVHHVAVHHALHPHAPGGVRVDLRW